MFVGIVKHRDKIISLYTSKEQHKIIEYFKTKVINFNMDSAYSCTGDENIYGRPVILNIYVSNLLK